MNKDEFKKVIKANVVVTADRVIDEEIDKLNKDEDFDDSDFDKLLEELKKRWLKKIRDKIGN